MYEEGIGHRCIEIVTNFKATRPPETKPLSFGDEVPPFEKDPNLSEYENMVGWLCQHVHYNNLLAQELQRRELGLNVHRYGNCQYHCRLFKSQFPLCDIHFAYKNTRGSQCVAGHRNHCIIVSGSNTFIELSSRYPAVFMGNRAYVVHELEKNNTSSTTKTYTADRVEHTNSWVQKCNELNVCHSFGNLTYDAEDVEFVTNVTESYPKFFSIRHRRAGTIFYFGVKKERKKFKVSIGACRPDSVPLTITEVPVTLKDTNKVENQILERLDYVRSFVPGTFNAAIAIAELHSFLQNARY
jgi:hypothetical protein